MNFTRLGDIIGAKENPLANLALLTEDGSTAAGGQTLSICDSDYGDTLAKYGSQVQQDALRDIDIELPSYPQVFAANDKRNLSVFIGDTELEKNKGLWTYDANRVTATVFGQKIDWNKFPNAKIRVRYVPVDAAAKTTKLITETAAK